MAGWLYRFRPTGAFRMLPLSKTEGSIVFFCFVTSRKSVFHSVIPVTKAFVTGLFRTALTAVLPCRKKAGSLRENMELLAIKSPMFFQKSRTYF
ncbi:MAG: hypothetical protein LBL81_00455 [Tannerella sp.]|jgi:hypothetical protein|nr:hypothetical protein [Tannerella sp.]